MACQCERTHTLASHRVLANVGVRRDIAERVLGHAIPGVEGVYDRHHYGDEKAEALKQLAHLVETIVNPQGNVVAMTRGRRQTAAQKAGALK